MRDTEILNYMESVVEHHLQMAIIVFQNLPVRSLQKRDPQGKSIITSLTFINKRMYHFLSLSGDCKLYPKPQKKAGAYKVVQLFIELQEQLLHAIRNCSPENDPGDFARRVYVLLHLVYGNEQFFRYLFNTEILVF